MQSIGRAIGLLLFLFSVEAMAHGEDKPGPSGGFIKMPGGFHTEVVADGKHNIRIYLLDMAWKNPLVKSSNVSVELRLSAKPGVEQPCFPKSDHFVCRFPNELGIDREGTLIVRATRNGAKGTDAVYKLPLKLEPKSGHSVDHSGHGH